MAAGDISQSYLRTYEQNLIHLVQQKASKTRGTVTERGTDSADHQFMVMAKFVDGTVIKSGDTVGTNIAAGNASTVLPETVVSTQTINNRVVTPNPLYIANAFKKSDITRSLIDPQSALLHNQAMSLGRKIDSIILSAAIGTATDSLGTGGLTLPVAQQLGSATDAPAFALVTKITESMLEADIDPSEEKFLVVSPNFVVNLLNDAKATSSDYATGRALMTGGIVQGWMGFTWICLNGLTSPGGAGPYQRYGVAYTKDAIGLKVNQDIQTTVDRIPERQNSILVQSSMDLGAVRIQDEKVFRIHYLETN
jgi:hypothetical protein